jgi:competence protein ComEC
MGERIVAPCLWAEGIRSLDALVLTHAHPDHVGGAAFLARAFQPAMVWEGIAPRADAGYARLEAELTSLARPRLSVARGLRTSWDGVSLEVLGPRPAPSTPRKVRNDDSIVLRVRFGTVCLLLTGDVEAAGEALAEATPCAVLKVAHHGSRTSTSPGLLAAVRPSLAVVSAGFRNPFGHPHPDVLERLARTGTLVLRTDRDGTVRLVTDGRRVWVREAFGSPPARLL